MLSKQKNFIVFPIFLIKTEIFHVNFSWEISFFQHSADKLKNKIRCDFLIPEFWFISLLADHFLLKLHSNKWKHIRFSWQEEEREAQTGSASVFVSN